MNRLVLALALILPCGANGAEIEFSLSRRVTGKNLKVYIEGSSFLKEGALLPSIDANFEPKPGKRMHSFLIWAGELKEKTESPPSLQLRQKKRHVAIRAQWSGWDRSKGWVYAAMADVTKILKVGPFSLSELKAEALSPGERYPYSLAGWSLVHIYREKGNDTPGAVTLLLGPKALPPAERHDVPLPLDTRRERVTFVGFVGGHGIAGNAAANLFQLVPITAKRDWAGEKGELWDYNFSRVASAPDSPPIFSFDPLLQWVFPIAILAQTTDLQ